MDWQKISEEPVWQGYRTVIKKSFRKSDNQTVDFEIKQEGETVCVLAFTESKKVLLTKQFRPGPEQVLYELPGGFKEKDENAEDAIKRELLEETGYTGNLELVTTSFVDAYSDMVKYNFIAQNCHKINGQNLDKSEHIEIMEMSLQEFRQHLRSGKLTDITTSYLGLDYLKLL